MPRRKGDSFTYFAMILYPEDDRHKRILDYIKGNRVLFPEYLYILHDKDEVEEDERDTRTTGLEEHETPDYKKAHWHVLVKYYMQKSEGTFLSQFAGALSKVIGISDYMDQVFYFTHENPKAFFQHKHVYPVEELHGTAFFLKKRDTIQNSYFVQFFNVVQGIKDTPHGTFYEYLEEVNKLPVDEKNYIMSIIHVDSHSIKNAELDIRYMKERGFIK